MKIFAEICKVNDEERMVYGYASTEALDVQGERVSKDALAKALPDYMRFANIREMHQPSAVGVAKSAEIDEKGLYIAAKVVDDDAWNKVKEGVYKGFSIGGKSVSKVDNTITDLRLSEISLVDRPANPECMVEVWKADGVEPQAAIDELAAMLDKGDVTPARLLELAKADRESPPAVPADVTGDASPAADSTAPQETQPEVTKADNPAAADGKVEKGFEGEEIWDASQALDALSRIQGLLYSERAEGEKNPDQVAALEAAIAAIKTFIVSEIQEDNIEMADKGGDVTKVYVSLTNEGNMAKADIAKMIADEIAKAVAPLHDQLAKANAEVERMKNLPMPGKALLKAVGKADDVVSDHDTKKADVADSNLPEAASLIKMIHQQGGIIR